MSEAVAELCGRANTSASGEFIASSGTAEVHVYLQCGRIAWATDSSHPLAFTAYLRRHAPVDAEAFGRVVDRCRASREPLGESLVARGLATPEHIGEALAQQIELALRTLAQLPSPRTVFLVRGLRRYQPRFTFPVEEMLARASQDPAPWARAAGGSRP